MNHFENHPVNIAGGPAVLWGGSINPSQLPPSGQVSRALSGCLNGPTVEVGGYLYPPYPGVVPYNYPPMVANFCSQTTTPYSPNGIFSPPFLTVPNCGEVVRVGSSPTFSQLAGKGLHQEQRQQQQHQSFPPHQYGQPSSSNNNQPSAAFKQPIFAIPSTLSNLSSLEALPASAFEEEAVAPMIDPMSLKAVNHILPVSKNSVGDTQEPPDDQQESSTLLWAARPRVAKTYTTTSVTLPLPSSSGGPSRPIPLQTLRFYSPDFQILFEAPLHNLHCTQGLIQLMASINRQGFPAPQPPVTMCSHVYDTVFRRHFAEQQSLAQLCYAASDQSKMATTNQMSHRRTISQANQWLLKIRKLTELLPEETAAFLPPAPTRWAPVGAKQPDAVNLYSRTLASLYTKLNREGWCPLGGKCPHIHPFVVPVQDPSSSSSSAAKIEVPHPSITWSTVHTTTHPASAHPCFNPGFAFPVAPPNDVGAFKLIPSEAVFVTRGVLEFYKFVCMSTNKNLPELSPGAIALVCEDGELVPRSKLILPHINSSGSASDEGSRAIIATEKSAYCGLTLQHCAHYTKRGVCTLGPDCLFVHVVGQGSAMRLSLNFNSVAPKQAASEQRDSPDRTEARRTTSSNSMNNSSVMGNQYPHFVTAFPPMELYPVHTHNNNNAFNTTHYQHHHPTVTGAIGGFQQQQHLHSQMQWGMPFLTHPPANEQFYPMHAMHHPQHPQTWGVAHPASFAQHTGNPPSLIPYPNYAAHH